MDCAQLYRDIAELTEQREKLRDKLERMNESMEGEAEMRKMVAEAEELENAVLERYLDNFAEKNPGWFGWQLGEQIVGPESEGGYDIYVNSIVPLPDGSAIVGDIVWVEDSDELGGMTFRYKRDENGKWEVWLIKGFEDNYGRTTAIHAGVPLLNGNMLLGGGSADLMDDDAKYSLYEYWTRGDDEGMGPRIEGIKNSYGTETDRIEAMVQMPNGNILIGAGDVLYEYGQNDDGEWGLKEERIEFAGRNGVNADVWAMVQLPNGNVLVGGSRGVLREYGPDENGKWGLGPAISGFEDGKGHYSTICAMARLTNGHVLIGGSDGALYEYGPDESGEWKLGPRITGVALQEHTFINGITPLADGGALVNGDKGILCECGMDEKGKWEVKSRIGGFTAVNGNDAEVGAMARLADGTVLVGGSRGALRELKSSERTVERLKEGLGVG